HPAPPAISTLSLHALFRSRKCDRKRLGNVHRADVTTSLAVRHENFDRNILGSRLDARSYCTHALRYRTIGQHPSRGTALRLLVEDRKSTRLNSSHVKISYA